MTTVTVLERDWCAHCRERIALVLYGAPTPLPGLPPADDVELWVTNPIASPSAQSVCGFNDNGHEPAGTSLVTVVWSAYGHRFSHEDENESCFQCGAQYALRVDPDDPTRGGYVNGRGETPMDCVELRDLVHGIERNCERDNGKPCNGGHEPCEHTDHDCNCLLCG